MFEAAFKEVPGLDSLREGKTPEFDQFAIWVVADYGPENQVVSVRRNFDVTRSGDRWLLRPENINTEQVRSGKARRRIEQLLEEKLTG